MRYFYPRPPRGGRRTTTARPATPLYFYPRPPRGGRLLGPSRSFLPGRRYFYPRPPRGGRRGDSFPDTGKKHFYPRPPRGGRPASLSYLPPAIKISIHALREEGDRRTAQAGSKRPYFYPRPPRGGRPAHPDVFVDDPEFLSTPSARRATYVGMMVEN